MSAKSCRVFITTLALLLILSSLASGAPHGGDRFSLAQPDGDRLEVLVWGDEFYQRVTSLDGYTLVRDSETRVICYARLDHSGSAFISTEIDARRAPPTGVMPGLELPKESRAAIAAENHRPFVAEAALLSDAKVDPVSTGEVLGLTIIIDFSDEPGTVPAIEIERYLNQPDYDGFGNNGSIRDYFLDVSGGLLDYTNEATIEYLRAPQPKSYYDDEFYGYIRSKELVRWGLETLDAEGLDFSRFDANDDGFIDAVNVFYAGYPDQGWSHGLWPHCGYLQDFEADGVEVFRYQLTNIGTEVKISTFCHENGHMLMMWPDLYDYGFESRGIGYYGLMCSRADPTNPVRPCAWSRMDAGWVDPELLTISQTGLVASDEEMNVFMIPSEEPNEYYLVENLQQAGRGLGYPDAGLAIWHIDHHGSNNNEQQTPESHYLVTLVQADGRWDLEHKNNRGDDTDLWHAPDFMEFSVRTNPSATWWDGSTALFSLLDFSEPGPVMTFDFMTHEDQTSLAIAPEPAASEVAWILTGPRDLYLEGYGSQTIQVVDNGAYEVAWADLFGWGPPAQRRVGAVVSIGQPATISGHYPIGPFAIEETGEAEGTTCEVQLIDIRGAGDLEIITRSSGTETWADVDGDGHQDVIVGGGDLTDDRLLLCHEGIPLGDGFLIHDPSLELTGVSRHFSWSDLDLDGDLDLLVLVEGGTHLLYRLDSLSRRDGPVFTRLDLDFLDTGGVPTSAIWCDFDRDGWPDCLVTHADMGALIIRSTGQGNFRDASGMIDVSISASDAAWGDLDDDLTWDVYVQRPESGNELYLNYNDFVFTRIVDWPMNHDGPGRAIAAADFNNDGHLDLYLARDGATDAILFSLGDGEFERSPVSLAGTEGGCTSLAVGDLDNDGGVDVVIGRDGAHDLILRNQILQRGHWLSVNLQADDGRLVEGAFARVVAGDQVQVRRPVHGRLHVGIDEATRVDSLIVHWPDGGETVYLEPRTDLVQTLVRGRESRRIGNQPVAGTELSRVYPNPFNPRTTLEYSIQHAGQVRLEIYDIRGRRVMALIDESLPPGLYTTTWDGTDDQGRRVPSGQFFARLSTADGESSRSLSMIK